MPICASPTCTALFAIDGSNGLTNNLAGDPMELTIQRITDQLWVIVGGPVPPNPSELLSGRRMDAFCEELRRRFDYVIIDSAPLLAVSDAAALSRHVDGVLLVAQAKRVSLPQLRDSLAILERVGRTAARHRADPRQGRHQGRRRVRLRHARPRRSGGGSTAAMDATDLLVVRHGQSEWNAIGRWQGHADPSLSELGRRQAFVAAAVDRRGRRHRLQRSAASRRDRGDHLRAARRRSGDVDERLRERNAGQWTGLTRAEIDKGWPGWIDEARQPEGFEDVDSVLERVVEAPCRRFTKRARAARCWWSPMAA